MRSSHERAEPDPVALEVRHLKLVRAIVDEGGVTAAARRLNLTQSALSHQLRDAEERLGAPLFHRLGRRLAPTPAGERVRRCAEQVLAELARLEEEVRGDARPARAVVRLSTECYTSYHWLPAALSEFEARVPGVEVRIVLEATRRPLAALLEGRLDLAVVTHRRRDRRLVYEPLFEDELVLVCAPGHPLAGRAIVTAEDLAAETVITYAIPTAETDLFRRVLAPAGVAPARVEPVELTEAILELVKAGRGVAAFASWAVAPEARAGRVAARPLTSGGVRRTWHAATRRGSRVAAEARELARVVSRVAGAWARSEARSRGRREVSPRARTRARPATR